MRRFLSFVVFAVVALATSLSFAASSCSITDTFCVGKICMLEYTWTAHTDGTFTSWTPTAPNHMVNGMILRFETDPGGTAPTALYDISMTDSRGVRIDGGSLDNRSATVTEMVTPVLGSDYKFTPNQGFLTLGISNNSVNSATGVVRVWWRKD